MKTRVALVIDTIASPTAGTEGQLLKLVQGLDRREFDPCLCVLQGSPWLEREFDLAPLHVLGIESFRNLSGWRGVIELARLFRALDVDVVHTHFRDASIAGLLAARLARVPGVVAARRNQGYWLTPRELWLQKRLNRFVDVFLANSESTRQWSMRTEGVASDRIRVVHNGLDLADFKVASDSRRDKARRVLGIPQDAPVAGIVANLRPVKRIDVFLRAAALVREQLPQAFFLVVGEGEQRLELEVLAASLGLDGSVRFLGRRRDVPRVLSAMDVGVLSSDSESFSNALVEYMAAGLAGVATDVGGAREAVDGGVGRVVPPGDAQALGRAVADLLQDPRELARARFRNPPHVAGLFSLERFVQAHERIYRELAALRRLNAA